MTHYLLDTNVIIRFLTQDEPKQSRAAIALFEQAQEGQVILHLDPSIIAEVVYVLESDYYAKSPLEIHDALVDLIGNPGIETESAEMVKDALHRYKEKAVDFADCWLAALSANHKIAVASFDRDLDKFNDIHRYEPK